jgi:hypothetical protein
MKEKLLKKCFVFGTEPMINVIFLVYHQTELIRINKFTSWKTNDLFRLSFVLSSTYCTKEEIAEISFI